MSNEKARSDTPPTRVTAAERAACAYLDACGPNAFDPHEKSLLVSVTPAGVSMGFALVNDIARKSQAGFYAIRHAMQGHRTIVIDDARASGNHWVKCLHCEARK